MPELGHVVFYVRDLERAIGFYSNIVGLTVVGKIFNNRAAMLSGGQTHHELFLIEVADAEAPLQGRRIGLYHVGWKIGDSLEVLKSKYLQILDMGYRVAGISDHTVSQSIYLFDPDGNEVELYVDNPQVDWQNDKQWMEAPVKPLSL